MPVPRFCPFLHPHAAENLCHPTPRSNGTAGTVRSADGEGRRLTYDDLVLLLAAILGIGLLLGWGLGGRLRNLGAVQIRLWPLALFGLVLQFVPVPGLEGTLGELAPVGMLLVSYAVLLFFVALNWRLRGFVLIGVGLALNALVIGANQGMPVSEYAARQSGQAEAIPSLASGEDPKHVLADDDALLLPLGDVIPVGSPFNIVVSLGDVVAYVGAAVFVATAMLGIPDRRWDRPDRHSTGRARMSGTRR